MIGFITQILKDGFSISSLKLLYITLVRPILEFGSLVWSPYLEYLFHKLQSCQNRFVRLVGVPVAIWRFKLFMVMITEYDAYDEKPQSQEAVPNIFPLCPLDVPFIKI